MGGQVITPSSGVNADGVPAGSGAQSVDLGLPVLMPDSSGNSGPSINARLRQLAASGGGVLYLGRGVFETNETIVIPTKCGLSGAAKESTILRKSAAFSDGNDLVSMAGTVGDNTGSTHKTGMVLSNVQLSAGTAPNIKSGLLLNGDYISTSYIGPIRFVGSPGTAVSLREAWDCTFIDFSANNCGGPLGEADAVMRILGSVADKANIINFVGTTRFETFRNMAISISDDGNGSLSGPYKINFFGTLKMESTILVSDATLFRSRAASSAISIPDVYMQMSATAARTGIRGIDLDGQSHKVGQVQCNIGANVSVVSLLKIPRTAGGGRIEGPIRVTGTTAALSMFLEADALNEAGNQTVYNDRAMLIGTVVPSGTIPLIGGSGVATAGYDFPQLNGTISRTATGDSTIQRNDLNRIVNFDRSTGTGLKANIGQEPARFGSAGDVIKVVQKGSDPVTITPTGAVTLIGPAALATTTGPNTEARAIKEATNVWRVF